jgi:transposase-like protein
MTRPAIRDAIYRGRVFDAEIIELSVRWYITYRLSYRDLVAMMAERGVEISHTTNTALGNSVRTRVREAVASFRAPYRLVLEGRRDLRLHSWQMALSLSRCG